MYRKSVGANSFLLFPPYFYFQLGLKCLSGTVFQRYSTCNIRQSLVDRVRVIQKIGRRQNLVLPVWRNRK